MSLCYFRGVKNRDITIGKIKRHRYNHIFKIIDKILWLVCPGWWTYSYWQHIQENVHNSVSSVNSKSFNKNGIPYISSVTMKNDKSRPLRFTVLSWRWVTWNAATHHVAAEYACRTLLSSQQWLTWPMAKYCSSLSQTPMQRYILLISQNPQLPPRCGTFDLKIHVLYALTFSENVF